MHALLLIRTIRLATVQQAVLTACPQNAKVFLYRPPCLPLTPECLLAI
jgi:hypothetical protein